MARHVVGAKPPARLPLALTRSQVQALLGTLDGFSWNRTMLLYGTGLRPMECLRLRVKDIEFSRNEIVAREGTGNENRGTMPPGTVEDPLQAHRGVESPADGLQVLASWFVV